MWSSQRPPHLDSSAYTRRETKFVNKEFQLGYTKKTVFMATIGALIFLIPVLFWTNQNYEFFTEMAYTIQPNLVNHIESERNTLNTLFFASLLGQIIFLALMGQRMTDKIVAPLKILRNHIRLLSRGHLNLPPMRVRATDEFHDLITTYNYFYSVLRAQAERDLQRIEEARTHATHPMARELLKEMILEKREQLDLPIESVLTSEISHDSRHVS